MHKDGRAARKAEAAVVCAVVLNTHKARHGGGRLAPDAHSARAKVVDVVAEHIDAFRVARHPHGVCSRAEDLPGGGGVKRGAG